MIYIPSILIVGFYFERHRALANGLTSSGSGIGTFIYSPLTHFLQNKYTWKGALLILSGIVLNCIVCGALYRPLNYKRKVRKPVKSLSALDDLSTLEKQLQLTNAKFKTQSHGNIPAATGNSGIVFASSHLNVCNGGKKDPLAMKSLTDMNSIRNNNVNHNRYTQSQNAICSSHRLLHLKNDHHLVYSQPLIAKDNVKTTYISQELKPLERKDIFYSGSLMRIPQYAQEQGIVSMTNVEKQKDVFDSEKLCFDKQKLCNIAELRRSFVQIAGLSLLKNPIFLIVMLSSVMWTSKLKYFLFHLSD